MPIFNNIIPINPVSGDVYYDDTNFKELIYYNGDWYDMDGYSRDFDLYNQQIERKEKLIHLKDISEK